MDEDLRKNIDKSKIKIYDRAKDIRPTTERLKRFNSIRRLIKRKKKNEKVI
jgi:hypothetical protein